MGNGKKDWKGNMTSGKVEGKRRGGERPQMKKRLKW